MAYTAWSVVASEIPSTAKWNLLGANDASFADGSGITALGSQKLSNPYKFSVWLNVGQSISNGTFQIPYDTKEFDTGTNFSTTTKRFTTPVNGYYQVCMQAMCGSAGMGSSENTMLILNKNGVEYIRSTRMNGQGDPSRVINNQINKLIYMAAGDYLDGYVNLSGARDITGGQNFTFFSGFLVSTS